MLQSPRPQLHCYVWPVNSQVRAILRGKPAPRTGASGDVQDRPAPDYTAALTNIRSLVEAT